MPEGEQRKKLYQKMLAQGFTSGQLKEAFEALDGQKM
jgi:hypothetical protein